MTVAFECKVSCLRFGFSGVFKQLAQLVFQGFFRQFAFHQLAKGRVKCMTADGFAFGDKIGAFETDSQDGDPGIVQYAVHFLGGGDGFLCSQRLIDPFLIHLQKLGVPEDDGGIEPCQLRRKSDRLLGRRNGLCRRIARQPDHQLDSQGKLVFPDQIARSVDVLHCMTPVGSTEHVGVEGLNTQLNDVRIVCFEIVQDIPIDIVGAGGHVDLVDEACVLVLFGDCQKCRLLRDGEACKTAAEKGQFDGLKSSPGESRKISFDCVSHVFGTHIAAAGGDGLLIAEDAVVGAAAVRDEDGYDGMFFHENIVPQMMGYGITNVVSMV